MTGGFRGDTGCDPDQVPTHGMGLFYYMEIRPTMGLIV